jgi:uncharacterized protein with ParB-like and HNH nuclease domain
MIQPKLSTVGEILAVAKPFAVPKYQRGFAWGKEQAADLLSDLSTESKDRRGLFLGTLIFNVSDRSHEGVTVVDGQQRLTTIFLLLIACRQLAKRLGIEGVAQETQKRITITDPTTAESKGALLRVSDSIREVFEDMTRHDWDGLLPQKVKNKTVKLKTRKIRPVYDTFDTAIRDFDKEQLGALLHSIYEARVIRIDIDGDEEAFSIFERTNARGTDLEVSDLLKNYLYQSNVSGVDDKWKEIIENSSSTILRMLKYFYVAKNGYISKTDLYTGLKDYCIQLGGPEQFVQELTNFSRFYNLIRQEKTDAELKEYLDTIGCPAISSETDKYQRVHFTLQAFRLFGVSQVYPVIYAALSWMARNGQGASKSASKQFIRLLESLENYHFVNNAICSRIGNEVEKIYADLCKKLSESKEFDKDISEFIVQLRGKLASEEEFETRFCEINYSDEFLPLISYIFDRVNNFKLDPGERTIIFNPITNLKRRNHNTEHFLPKKPDDETTIDSATLAAIDNIGNLLPMSFRANSSLGNLSPLKKIQKLEGELSRKTNNLNYLKDFVKQYASSAAEWNDKAIQVRARDMARDAYERVWKLA